MNLAALRSTLENQINQIIANADGELSSTDVGQLINRETQFAINRLSLLEDLPFANIEGLSPEKILSYRKTYRNMLDYLLSKNNDAFVVIGMLEDLRIHQAKDKITVEACMSDLARRCDSVYKSGWTIIKESFGYGEQKWADIWGDTCNGKSPYVKDRTMEKPQKV